MDDRGGGGYRRNYKRVWRNVKARAPMNPREDDKPATRKYLKWGERNAKMKIQQQYAQRDAGRPYQPARVGKWTKDKAHAKQRRKAYDRWVEQDERIDNWLDQ